MNVSGWIRMDQMYLNELVYVYGKRIRQPTLIGKPCGDISAKCYYVASCTFHDTFHTVKCLISAAKSAFSFI